MSEIDIQTELKITAIQQFILKSTVPILVEKVDGKPHPIGTGTLLGVGGRRFIITAQHLFEDDPTDLENLAIPDGIVSSGYTRLLKLVYTHPSNSEIDVAVIEITDSESIRGVSQHWNFLTLDNVDVRPSAQNVWLVGYPAVNVKDENKTLHTEPVTILTERLSEPPPNAAQPVHDGLDIFYLYDREAQVLGKTQRDTPELQGVSGAAVWDVRLRTVPDFWAPQRFAKMVGVQSSYIHSSYVRTKSWWAVARSMAKIDSELAEAVEMKTGVRP